MGKLIFAGLILVVALVGYFYCKRAVAKEATEGKKAAGRDYDGDRLNFLTWGKRISIGLLIIPVLTLILSTLRVIPAGHVGVPEHKTVYAKVAAVFWRSHLVRFLKINFI